VLIDPRRRSLEVFSRREDRWLLRAVPEDGRLRIAALDFHCDIDSVYEDVVFEPETGSGPDDRGRDGVPSAPGAA
jgi:hypothetical protein